MSTKSSVYYEGYGGHDCPKIFLPIKPVKDVEIFFLNVHLESLTMKKMSIGLSLSYDGYSRYDFLKNVLLIKPLKGVKQRNN